MSSEQLEQSISNILPAMIDLRRQLHRQPELSGQEQATAALLCQHLQQAGIAFRQGIGGHGILATIRCPEADAPWVAIRADMDALPIAETTGAAYASQAAGVSHCCGHDVHSAIAMGVALLLQQHRRALPHHVAVIFQPAEEQATGARAMLDDGVLNDFMPRRMHALHVFPHLPTGALGLRRGVMCAATDLFTITVRGKGGHAARPHECSDVILAASHMLQSINQIISRRVNAGHQAVLSIGRFQSGFAANVMPEEASFSGTIRSLHPEAHQQIRESIQNMSRHIAAAWCVQTSFELQCSIPLLRNDDAVMDMTERCLRQYLPETSLVMLDEASMGGEDFAEFLAHVPGCLLRLGTCGSEASAYPLHHPSFDIDESAMRHGMLALLALACN